MISSRNISGLTALLLGLLGGAAGQAVKVSNGTIQGVRCADTSVNSFLGIPFAKAPTGDLRFAAPQPYDSKYSGGTLQATKQPPSCPQFGTAFAERGATSEDCLFLNVYVPENATSSSKLPVKVWIYGGSNEVGGIADPTYNGCFSAGNTILVSINYRVGPLGWLALPDFGINGNFGTLDQLLALAWIQENIASFGGDPTRVLLFGQSAGAANSFLLATLPQAPKLFSAVALESGGGRSLATIKQVTPWNKEFAKQLGCSDAACLRAASVQALNETEVHLSANSVPGAETLLMNGGKGTTWSPVIDGATVPVSPLTAGLRVPAIAGSNAQDGTFFVLGTYHAAAFTLNQTSYSAFLTANFGPLADAVNTAYPLAHYPGGPNPAYLAMSAVITAHAYKCPTRRALRTGLANGHPVFAYAFNHTPSCAWYQSIPEDPRVLRVLGATHTAEIPFVFNLTRGLPPPGGNCSFSVWEDVMAEVMVGAWDGMARDGRPGAVEGGGGVWPAWTEQDGLGMVVDGDAGSFGKVDYEECDFWDGIDEKVAGLAQNGTAPTGGGGTASSTATTAPTSTAKPPKNEAGEVRVGFWMVGTAALGAAVALMVV